MDGITLKRTLADVLSEDPDQTEFLEDQISYRYLYQAAIEFVHRTQSLSATTTITTVATQANYGLPSDFLSLYLRDPNERLYIKYNDGSDDTFIHFKDEGSTIYANNTNNVSIPDTFYIRDTSTLTTALTGTAGATSALSGGKSTLTGTGFTAGASAGDTVHNTTDNSRGVVLSVSSNTQVVTALFEGTNNYWTSGDAYVLNQNPTMDLMIDPPSLTAGHTITVQYLVKPAPVFSDYDRYRFPSQYTFALCKYAAWLYKYRDRAPNTGDRWLKYWEREVRRGAYQQNTAFNKKGYKVFFKSTR